MLEVPMGSRIFAAVVVCATVLQPSVVPALAQEAAPTAGQSTLINGTTEAQPHGNWSGTYQNTGINLLSARQTGKGLVVRVKRLIKPGGDAAKEFARGIPIFSTAANWATLGLYNRALKSDGEAVRTTWLGLDCFKKTFNVSGDGYSWQNIYKDQYGQAEDLYYQFCESSETGGKPRYLSLPPADPEMLRSAQIEK
ncbi:MAG: hypothetical protein VKP63_04705 [Cyanobacteriota bacterium]|nr:hypothetical protein [Cyanobacteriota bacterium]